MQLRHAAVPWRALSWTVVETVDETLASWQALAARAPDQPFQHPAWIAAWLETRGRVLAVRPRIVVGHHRDSCEIVVPLGITGRGPGRVLRWLAGDSSDYNAPLASPELRASFPPDDAAAFWRCIADLAGPAAVLDLGNQPERIAGAANRFIAKPIGAEACRAHSLRLPTAAGAGSLSKRHRKRLRALERSHGKAAFVILSAGQDCGLAVRRIIDWKRGQLMRSGGFSPFEADGVRECLSLAASDPAMPIRVALLRTASATLAGFILIDGGEAELIYQCSYDPAFALSSPGTILRELVERDCIGRGKTLLDFGPGDEAYKGEVCDTSMRLLRTIRPLQPSGVALAMMLRTGLQVKRWIKATSTLYAAICRAHRLAIVVRGRLRSRSAFRRNPETLETA
jgi:CelD/BcsL family acetyltransferase involved in cellulose biosynthesis